jgi:hypothetical protein
VRHAIALPTVIAALSASLIAGCGGGSDSSSTSAATSTTTSASSPCADIAKVQSAASDFKQLDPSTASAKEVKGAIYGLGLTVKGLSSSASQAAGQAQSSLKSAASTFQSQLKSAVNQPVSKQLTTIGTALGQLESSLSQTKTQLNCNQ